MTDPSKRLNDPSKGRADPSTGRAEAHQAEGPRREVVRATPRRPGRRGPLPGTADLYARDEYAATLLASLMRAQLGVTVGILVPAAAVLAIYPLLSMMFPAVASATVGPLPLAVVILGGGIYPPLVLLGFWYVRRAARVEQRFAELLADR